MTHQRNLSFLAVMTAALFIASSPARATTISATATRSATVQSNGVDVSVKAHLSATITFLSPSDDGEDFELGGSLLEYTSNGCGGTGSSVALCQRTMPEQGEGHRLACSAPETGTYMGHCSRSWQGAALATLGSAGGSSISPCASPGCSPPPGGCGVCIPPSYCVLGFCITGCVVKWQCDFPDEDCINGQCQTASPVVARVGAQDFLSVVSVWETAISDAAGGVCIHWNGKDQKCTMTGWPVDPYVGHLVWLTDEEYDLLNQGAELVVDVALNLIGSASPQLPGVSPDNANGFASLERALGTEGSRFADFSGCPSDFAEGRKLYFWLDHDTVGKRNGLMQASELEPAAYTGLFGFYPETLVESKQVDAHGNWLRFWVDADCADCGGVMVDYFPVLDPGDLLPPGSIPPAGNACRTVPADVPFGFGPLLMGDQ